MKTSAAATYGESLSPTTVHLNAIASTLDDKGAAIFKHNVSLSTIDKQRRRLESRTAPRTPSFGG